MRGLANKQIPRAAGTKEHQEPTFVTLTTLLPRGFGLPPGGLSHRDRSRRPPGVRGEDLAAPPAWGWISPVYPARSMERSCGGHRWKRGLAARARSRPESK